MDSSPGSPVLSDYEKLRLDKIRRNEARLRELGLDKGLLPKPPVATRIKKDKKKKTTKDNVEGNTMRPTRRSTRKRKVLDYNEAVVSGIGGADSDYDDANTTTEDEDEDESVEQPRPATRRKKSDVPTAKAPPSAAALPTIIVPSDSTLGGLTLELAKTGRSTCRKCKTKIEKGTPRVGMTAWIVGRQAITWQCPGCFLDNFACGYDPSGRTRCKSTGAPFERGELRVGARSHTATSWYKADAFRAVLAGVLALVDGGEQHDGILAVESVEGSELLDDDDRERLRSILAAGMRDASDKGSSLSTGGRSRGGSSKKEVGRGDAPAPETSNAAPEVGVKSGAKGRVQWKFGGHTCYGTLLPSKETKTHCFARTHKGNVKTLAKGKHYWSIIEQ